MKIKILFQMFQMNELLFSDFGFALLYTINCLLSLLKFKKWDFGVPQRQLFLSFEKFIRSVKNERNRLWKSKSFKQFWNVLFVFFVRLRKLSFFHFSRHPSFVFSERRHRSRKTFFVLKHFVRSQKRCPSLPEMLVQALHI